MRDEYGQITMATQILRFRVDWEKSVNDLRAETVRSRLLSIELGAGYKWRREITCLFARKILMKITCAERQVVGSLGIGDLYSEIALSILEVNIDLIKDESPTAAL